jgi:hypothetical protein
MGAFEMKGDTMRTMGLFISMMISTYALPATYYVDFVGGSDANVGTSKATAWKLAPGMPGFAAWFYKHAAGDQFIFKGGVTWPKTALPFYISYSGAAGAVDVYGGEDQTWYAGESWSQPIIDGQQLFRPNAVLIGDNGKLRSFVKIDNLYVKNSGNAETGKHNGPNAAATLTETSKNWAVNHWVNYYLYDTTAGSHCQVTANTPTTATCTLAGGTKNAWSTGDAYVITDGSGTAISFSGGGSSIEISHCTLQPRSVQSIAYSATNTNSAHIYIHNNSISLGGRFVIYGYTGHVVDDVQVYANLIQGSGGTPLGGYHLDGLMIGNPSITECSATLKPTVTHISFHHNYLYGSWPGGPTALYFSNACTNYTTIYNNVFALETVETKSVGALMRWQDFDGNISIYNNTFSTDANPGYGAGANEAIQLGASYKPHYGALVIENNIFSGLGIDIAGGAKAQWSSIDVDCNLHNPSNTHGYGEVVWFSGIGNSGQCISLACAQKQGWEVHSPTVGAPQFVSVPNGTAGSGDFYLLSGSPALGTGINLSSVFTTDAAGNPRPSTGPWDMGAYVEGSNQAKPVISGQSALQNKN